MKYLSILIVVFSLFASSADAEENTFKSVTVGFEVTKPVSWQFITAERNLENLQNMEWSDENVKRFVIEHSTAPLVAMMKHPEPFDDLNPSFKVQAKPFGQFKGTDPKQILVMISGPMKKMFKDFTVVQEPTDVVVSDIPSAYMRINYSLQIPDGRTFPTTSEVWIVPKDDYFFMIGAGTRQDEKTGSREEIRKILDSVRIQ